MGRFELSKDYEGSHHWRWSNFASIKQPILEEVEVVRPLARGGCIVTIVIIIITIRGGSNGSGEGIEGVLCRW